IVLLEENRTLLADNCLVIALAASVDEIMKRLNNDTDRPLLQGDKKQLISQRLQEREGMYDFAHYTVNTTDRDISSITDEIIHIVQGS
ncbi:MAG: shikimate kinase, partial [Bacilli bacterium]